MSEQLYRWVKASARLPEGRGKGNSVIIRGRDLPKDKFGHGIVGEFVTTGFVNYDEKSPEFYFIYGSDSYLSNETIEWLEPLPSPGDNQSLEAEIEKEAALYATGMMGIGEYNEKNWAYADKQTWHLIKRTYMRAANKHPRTSPVSGSLEDAAEKYSNKIVPHKEIILERTRCENVWLDVHEAFLAGAAYGKVGEEKRLDKMWMEIEDKLIEAWRGAGIANSASKSNEIVMGLKNKYGPFDLQRSSQIVDELKKIAKLSTYDPNHDNMLYNMKDIHALAKELLNQSK